MLAIQASKMWLEHQHQIEKRIAQIDEKYNCANLSEFQRSKSFCVDVYTIASNKDSPPPPPKSGQIRVRDGGYFDLRIIWMGDGEAIVEYDAPPSRSGEKQSRFLVQKSPTNGWVVVGPASQADEDRIKNSGDRVVHRSLLSPKDALPAVVAVETGILASLLLFATRILSGPAALIVITEEEPTVF